MNDRKTAAGKKAKQMQLSVLTVRGAHVFTDAGGEQSAATALSHDSRADRASASESEDELKQYTVTVAVGLVVFVALQKYNRRTVELLPEFDGSNSIHNDNATRCEPKIG